jgi:hypothetical protein
MGCQQMDAVSYPHPKVIEFFETHLAPVRVLITSKPLPQQFKVHLNLSPGEVLREFREKWEHAPATNPTQQ